MPTRTAAGIAVLASALCLYTATAGGSMATTDAVVAFDVTKAIVERHSLALSGNLLGLESMRGVDGRYYSPFGIAQSIYNVPFYLAGRTAQRALGIRVGGADTIPKAAVAVGGAIAAALAVWVTFLLGSVLYGDPRLGLLAAGLLGTGTLLWPYSKFGFNQPLAAMFLAATALFLVRSVRPPHGDGDPRAAARAGVWAGLALLTRHEMGLIVVVALGYLVLASPGRTRRAARLAMAFCGAFAVALAVWAALNMVRFGNPLDTGLLRDPTPGFGSPLWRGVAGLLFSPGASLFLFSPVLVLFLPAWWHHWRTDRATAWLLGAPALLLLLLYGQMANWVGGRSYGGRYLVAVLPLCCAALPPWIAARRSPGARWAVALICVASVAIQLPGVVVDFGKAGLAWARQYPAGQLPDRRWVPEASGLAINTRAMLTSVPANVRYLTGRETPPATSPEGREGNRDFSQQFVFSLDFWWLYAFYLRLLSARVAVAAGAALTAMAVAFGLAAWRRTRDA